MLPVSRKNKLTIHEKRVQYLKLRDILKPTFAIQLAWWAFIIWWVMKLTAKQQAFIREYLVDFNATQACIRAGYSKKTANEQGAQNLAKLSKEIKLYQDKIAANAEITQQDIIKRLSLIAFDKLGEDIHHKDQIKALELIGKHIGMFSQKIELTGKDGNAIAITNIDAVDVASRLLSDTTTGGEKGTSE